MTDKQLKKKIWKVLKEGCFKGPDDLVDVSDGPAGDIHVLVVSRKFDGRRMKARDDMVWSELVTNLTPEEWGKVTLSMGTSPEEIKAI